MIDRHKVFVSYHHAGDQVYRNLFERLFADDSGIMVSKSVDIGDIATNLHDETIRQKIRDDYIRDATVTVVLIGKHTWQRKHVDWEISSSLRDTTPNPRCGLLGIFLPTYPLLSNGNYRRNTIPPRLWDNIECEYAEVYGWSENPNQVSRWIHSAFERRKQFPHPNLRRPLFKEDLTGASWQ